MNLFKKCIAEFIGTFAIVFGGCGAIIVDQLTEGAIGHPAIGLVFGLIVMTMVYATGHISGAHLNPAVTIAFSLSRHFPKQEILPYIISQCLGALFASMIHLFTLGPILVKQIGIEHIRWGLTQPYDGLLSTVLIWESFLTFFLMFVIMAVATDYRAVGNAAGIAIGGVVAFDAIFGGPITGASLNPARSFGPALISGKWEHFIGYVIGPIIGALLASLIYEFIRCNTKDNDKAATGGCC